MPAGIKSCTAGKTMQQLASTYYDCSYNASYVHPKYSSLVSMQGSLETINQSLARCLYIYKRLCLTIDMILCVKLIFVTIAFHLVDAVSLSSSSYKGKDLCTRK